MRRVLRARDPDRRAARGSTGRAGAGLVARRGLARRVSVQLDIGVRLGCGVRGGLLLRAATPRAAAHHRGCRVGRRGRHRARRLFRGGDRAQYERGTQCVLGSLLPARLALAHARIDMDAAWRNRALARHARVGVRSARDRRRRDPRAHSGDRDRHRGTGALDRDGDRRESPQVPVSRPADFALPVGLDAGRGRDRRLRDTAARLPRQPGGRGRRRDRARVDVRAQLRSLRRQARDHLRRRALAGPRTSRPT